jgi:hypothetical protein
MVRCFWTLGLSSCTVWVRTSVISSDSAANLAQLHFYQYAQHQDETALETLTSLHDMFVDWSADSGDNLEATSLRNRASDIIGKLLQAATSGMSEDLFLSPITNWNFDAGR